MSNFISLSQAFAQWQELAAGIPSDDRPMLSESWNDHTDSLTKDGQLSALQYHYAPAYDEPMPGEGERFDPLSDDRAFILDAMGVAMSVERIASRPDDDGSEWNKGARHWQLTITRGNESAGVLFSQGSAHDSEPELQEVLYCLLTDAESAAESFEDWADSLGYDNDSRRTYRTWEACKRTAADLARLFTASELSDLAELYEGY